MARTSRTTITPTTRPRGAAKLALFEVIRSSQSDAAIDEMPTAPARSQPQPTRSLRLADDNATEARSAPHGPLSRALGAAAVAVLVVGVAAVILRGKAESPATTAVTASAPMPSVLDLSDPAARRGVSSDSNTGSLANLRLPTESQVAAPVPITVGDVRRTNGLNYLIVQSYAKTERDRADATRDALLKEGVGATIETGIPGWGSNICVVGTVGFERIRNNVDYQAYCQRLDAVSEKYKSDRKVKAFDPRPFHWTLN